MKRYLLISLFSLCSLLLAAQSTIAVVVSELPPLTSEKESSRGLLIDLLLAAFEDTPYSFDFRFFPLARSIVMRNKGETTVTFGSEGLFDKNEYRFIPICKLRVVFFYKKAHYPLGISDVKISDLAPFRIGVLNSSPMVDTLKKAGITNIDLGNSEETNLKKLALDRVDLVLMTDLFGIYLLKGLGEDIYEYAMTEGYILPPTCLLVSKSLPNSEDIIQTFVAGYSRIKANGKLIAILEQYFGKGQIPSYFIQ